MTGSRLRGCVLLGWAALVFTACDASAAGAPPGQEAGVQTPDPVRHETAAAGAEPAKPSRGRAPVAAGDKAAEPDEARGRMRAAADDRADAATGGNKTGVVAPAGGDAKPAVAEAASPPAAEAAPVVPAPVADPTAGDRTALINQDVAQHPPQTSIASRDPSHLRTAKMKLGGLLDRSVHSLENSEVGRVIDVMTGDDGKPAALELDVGGFLGVGNRRIAVAWSLFDLSRTGQNDPLRVALSAAQVRSAPAMDDSGDAQVVTGAAPIGAPVPKPDAAAPPSAATPPPAGATPAAPPPAVVAPPATPPATPPAAPAAASPPNGAGAATQAAPADARHAEPSPSGSASKPGSSAETRAAGAANRKPSGPPTDSAAPSRDAPDNRAGHDATPNRNGHGEQRF